MPLNLQTGKGVHFASLVGFSIVPALGILSFRLTAWTVFRSDLAFYVTDAYLYSRLAQLALMLLLIFLDRKREYTLGQAYGLIAVSSIVMSVGSTLLFLNNNETVSLVACVLHGMGSSTLFLGWGIYTCILDPKKAALNISLAFVLYGVCSLLLQGVPSHLLMVLAVGLPLLCGVLLAYCFFRSRSFDEIGKETPSRETASGLPRDKYGVLIACALIVALSEIIVPSSASKGLFSSNYFWLPLYLIIFIIFLVWVFGLKRDNPDQLWLLFTCIVFIGLLCFSSFLFFDWSIASGIMRATQDCLLMFSWIFIAGSIHRNTLPRALYFGLGILPFTHTDTIEKILQPWYSPHFNADSGGLIIVGLSFGMAVFLIIYTLVLMSKSSTGAKGVLKDAQGSQGVPTDNSPDALIKLARVYDLSSRESEVCKLLLKGYSLSKIGEELIISHNTVRSHAKSIYRKLGIHSKQELIKLAEQMSVG